MVVREFAGRALKPIARAPNKTTTSPFLRPHRTFTTAFNIRVTTTNTTASRASNPQRLPSRAIEDHQGPYHDISLLPAPPSAGRSISPSLRPPEPAYLPASASSSRPPSGLQPYQNQHQRRRSRSSFTPFSRLYSNGNNNNNNTSSGNGCNPRPRRFQPSRLWNPINHLPRTAVTAFSTTTSPADAKADPDIRRDAYPLLSVPERRRSRQLPNPNPSSLFVEHSVVEDTSESSRTSIGLPSGHRRSGHLYHHPALHWSRFEMGDHPEGNSGASGAAEKDVISKPGPALLLAGEGSSNKRDINEPAITDVPRHVQSLQSFRSQTFASFPSGTGLNSSRGHSQGNGNAGGGVGGGLDGEGDLPEELPWGPAHPCFPHMNSHVPIDSADYANSRIIRIRRNWMFKGDLAPTFSNLYPEILDPLLPEQEFRTIVSKLNTDLTVAFDPSSTRNWVDNIVGMLTGWIWDDLGASGVKSRLISLENYLESWNKEVGAPEGVKIWPLRSTGYMCLDIQIPDPKVRVVDSEPDSAPVSRPSSVDGR